MPPQSLRCLRRHCDCCQPARRLVERRLLPTKGQVLQLVARLTMCPGHVDGRRARGPKYEAGRST